MECKIIWTEDALRNLKEISDFIAEDNPEAALRFGIQLIERIELLRVFPKRGRFYSAKTGDIRLVVLDSYKIFYRFDDSSNAVTIRNIWHGARQEPDFK